MIFIKAHLTQLSSKYNDLKIFILQCVERDINKRFNGGWPMIKKMDIFKKVKFEELEGYNKINALELKKDIIQYKRTKIPIIREFQIKTL